MLLGSANTCRACRAMPTSNVCNHAAAPPCLCPADCRLLIVDRIEAGHQAALEFEQREARRQERIQQQQQQQQRQQLQAADAGAAAAQTTAEGAGGGNQGVDEGQQAGSPPQPAASARQKDD